MTDACGYVEFYITANPPLLPNGVSGMIKADDFPKDKVVEVLYEPEVPWFKIISSVNSQDDVRKWFEDRLELMLQHETGLVHQDSDDEFDYDENDEPSKRTDVQILNPDSLVIPWCLYQDKGYANTTEYDKIRYPEPLSTLPYKCVWRGLESVEGLTLAKLLTGYSFLWGHSDATVGIEKLSEASKCQITHNMGGTLVYIGSDHHASSPDNAIQKLQTLLAFREAKSFTTTHLVFTEGSGPFQVFQSYLSHLGLFRMTYVEAHHPCPRDEYQRLGEATSLRVATQDPRGRWIADSSKYAAETHPDVSNWKPLSAWEGYAHRVRQPFADPRPKRRLLSSGPLPVIASIPPVSNVMGETSATLSATLLPETDSETRRDEECVLNIYEASPKPELYATHGPVTGADMINKRRATNRSDKEALNLVRRPISRTNMDSRTSDAVSDWIDTVEKSNPSELDALAALPNDFGKESPCLEEKNGSREAKTLKDELLVDLGPDPEPSLLNTEEEKSSLAPSRSRPDLLIDIDPMPQTPERLGSSSGYEDVLDRESPVKQFHRMFATLDPSTIREPKCSHQALCGSSRAVADTQAHHDTDLLDSYGAQINIVSLMDTRVPRHVGNSEPQSTNGSIAVFQREEELKKEVFYTMRQKASKGGSWAQITKNAKMPPPDPKAVEDFGTNVRVTHTQKSGQYSRGASQDIPVPAAQSSPQAKSTCGSNRGKLPQQNETFFTRPTDSSRVGPSWLRPPSEVESAASRMYQVVPGLEAPILPAAKRTRRHNPANEGHETTLLTTDKTIKDLIQILQITPGHLTVEAKFGRASIKGLPSSVIGANTTWSSDEIVQELNQRESGDDGLGFYTILTTNGEEADILTRTRDLKGGTWTLLGRKTYYDFHCSHEKHNGNFIIEVDADSFEYQCRHQDQQELSSLIIHCAQRAWDIKICLHRTVEDVPSDLVDFAQELVGSLGVTVTSGNEVVIETKYGGEIPCSVGGLEVRRVATYHNKMNGSCLTLTETRRVERDVQVWKNKCAYRGTICQISVPGASDDPPTVWFEASIRSNNLQEVLKENTRLELGESTRWQAENLSRLIEEIVDPALRMVTQMDNVGRTNNNGYKQKLNQPFYDPVAAEQERRQEVVYW